MNQMVPSSTLSGEILGEGDQVRVLVAPHPLRTHREIRSARAGASLADISAEVDESFPVALRRCWRISLDGHVIDASLWHLVRPKSGTTVVLLGVPKGPLVAGIGALFSAVSAAFASVSTALGSLGFLGKVIGLGLSFAGKFLLNALFPARKPQLAKPPEAQEQSTPRYSVSASRNQSAPWEAVPVVLGEHRVTPYYAALPYTESTQDDQYLRLFFVWGYGPLAIDEIKVGETLLTSFQDVEVETFTGFETDHPTTIYTRQVVEEPLSVELLQVDGWQVRETAKDIIEIQIEVVLPDGLFRIAVDDPVRRPFQLVIEMQYRLVGDATWINLEAFDLHTMEINTVRLTRRGVVDKGQYEVRVRRTSADKDPDEKETRIDRAVWSALRGFRSEPPLSFPKPLALTAIRIRATSQLNGQLDTLNGRVRSYVNSFNTGVWALGLSRNPADMFRHVLQGTANASPVETARIDLDSLQAWHAYCATERFNFDIVKLERTSVYDTLLDICAAGRAIPFFRDGRWSVVWDERDTPIVQMFTPANSWGFNSLRRYAEPVHGWRVRFVNRDKGYIEDERVVYDDGYGPANASRFEGLEFPGVTDPAAIWKHGRFHIAQLRLRPETYTLNVDFEHLVCTRGDRVRVAHDAALIGLQSGRVLEIDDALQTVTLNETISIPDGPCRLRFRLANGNFLVRDVEMTAGAEANTLQLAGSGALPSVGDLFAFGVRDIETVVLRVLSIESQQDMSARITLVDDAPEIYAADTGAIPTFQSNVTAPLDPFTLAPADLRSTNRVVQADGDVGAVIRLSWTLPRSGRAVAFECQMRADMTSTVWRQVGSVPATQMFFEYPVVGPGLYSLRVRSLFDDGTFSGWATSEAVSTTSLLTPPADVSGFRVAVIGDLSILEWTPVLSAAVSHYEIRFIASDAVSGLDWNSATPLVPRAIGASAQIPTMVGSYLLKAVLATGVKSRNAAVVLSNVAALAARNVVEVIDEASSFAGALDRVTLLSSALRLSSRNILDTWEVLTDVGTMSAGDGDPEGRGNEVEGFYLFANGLDLGDVYTSRLSARIEAFGENISDTIAEWATLEDVILMDDVEPEDWSVELQFRTTDDDPAANLYGDWKPFIIGDVSARAFQFRLRLAGRAGSDPDAVYSTTTPVVTGLQVEVDMPDRTAGGNDIAVPEAGLRVSFDPPFIALKGLATNEQGLASGDRSMITDKGPTGFFIRFYSSAGAPVARSIDYVAKGYGSMLQ